MSKPWIRLYTDLPENSKIQRLPDHHFKFLINCWCLTGDNDDALPSPEDIAWRLRIDPAICQAYLDHLASLGILDKVGESYIPHNWEDRQFVSDDSKERVRKYRDRYMKHPKAVTDAVTVTAQEQIQNQSRAESDQTDRASRLTDGFPEEMRTHLKKASGQNISDDLLGKISASAQRYKSNPTSAAALFLDVHYRCMQQDGIKNGEKYLIAAFEKALAAKPN